MMISLLLCRACRCLSNNSRFHTVTLDMGHLAQEVCHQLVWCQGIPHSSKHKDSILTDSLLSNKACHTCHTQPSNSQDSQLWVSNHQWVRHLWDSHPCNSHHLYNMTCHKSVMWHNLLQDHVAEIVTNLCCKHGCGSVTPSLIRSGSEVPLPSWHMF